MNIHEKYPFRWKQNRTPRTAPIKEIVPINFKGERLEKKAFKLYMFEAFLNETIDVLELSSRAYNALRNNKINTIGDLIQKYEMITRTKGFGAKSLDTLNDNLQYVYNDWMRKHHPDLLREAS